MLTAVDVTGNTILARDAQKKQNYFCPACRQRVCLRLGQIRVQHFSHVQIMTCRAMSEGESVEHLFGKLQLHTYFVSLGYQVTLEKFLPAIQQRPDLVVESQGRCFIIEFQCAPISFETIKKRNTGYARIGLQVFWILGTPYQKQNLRQTTMAKFAQIQQNHLGFYYWVSQPSGGDLQWQEWSQVDGINGKNQMMTPEKIVKKQIYQIQLRLLRSEESLRSLAEKVCQQGRILTGVPWCVHNFEKLPGGLKNDHWLTKLSVLLALEGGAKSIDQLLTVIRQNRWYQFASEDVWQVQLLWLKFVLWQWLRQKIIRYQNGLFFLRIQPKWYSDYQDKQKCFTDFIEFYTQ